MQIGEARIRRDSSGHVQSGPTWLRILVLGTTLSRHVGARATWLLLLLHIWCLAPWGADDSRRSSSLTALAGPCPVGSQRRLPGYLCRVLRLATRRKRDRSQGSVPPTGAARSVQEGEVLPEAPPAPDPVRELPLARAGATL